MLINFIAAAIGMLLFRHNDAHNFGTLPAAFVSIWMIETLDNWEDLMWINILGCHVYAAADDARALGGGLGDDAEAPSSFGLLRYGYDEGRLARPCTRSGAQGFGWIAAAYFVFMVVLGGLVLPTVLIGIISVAFDDATRLVRLDALQVRRLLRIRL